LNRNKMIRYVLYIVITILIISFIPGGKSLEFIYFQF
jgi:hypothetical protein